MVFLITILVILNVLGWGGLFLYYRANVELRQQIADLRSNNLANSKTHDQERAEGFWAFIAYDQLAASAADEYVKDGKFDGPNFSAWLRVLGYISAGGIHWFDTLRERIKEVHEGVEQQFSSSELEIVLNDEGKGEMKLPEYEVVVANHEGKWVDAPQLVSKRALSALIGRNESAVYQVSYLGDVVAIGTAEVVKSVLGL